MRRGGGNTNKKRRYVGRVPFVSRGEANNSDEWGAKKKRLGPTSWYYYYSYARARGFDQFSCAWLRPITRLVDVFSQPDVYLIPTAIDNLFRSYM